MEFERKYGVAATIEVPLIKAGSNDQALGADYTPAAGDVTISKNGGTAANITTLPTAIAMGNGATWSFALSATEMQAARIVINVSDAATKAVEDQQIIIVTYGHVSAQHAFDRDIATQDVNVTQWLGSAAATPTVAGVPEVDLTHISGALVSATTAQIGANMVQVSGDSAAADNLEAQYDGTGYIDDNAPATQSQIQGLSIASAAQSVKVKSSPDGFVLITGSEINTENATQALDGVRHQLSDSAGTLDGYYKFDIGPFGLPVSAKFEAVVNGGNDTFKIYANIGSSGTPNWSPRQTVTGTGSTTNVSFDVPLYESDVLTDIPTEVWLRVYGTGLTSANFNTDFLSLSRSIQYQYSGYDNGAVWTDTTSGTAGTTLGYHGIASRPTLTFADALTIANNLGVHRHEFSNDSSVTLTSPVAGKILAGRGWTLALGGQDVTNVHVLDAKVSGVGTGSNVEFHDCRLTTVTLPEGEFHNCSVNGVFTCSAAGVYHFHQSHSGATTPTFDFGAGIGVTTLLMHNWKGAFSVDNLGAVGADIIHLAGDGEVTLNASCVGGTINIQGNWKVTNNGSGIAINYDDNTSNIVAALTDTNELQTDWTNGGRLDLIVDAIKVDTGTTLPGIIDDLAIKKNVAFNNFEFLMVLSSDGRTPGTGLTVSGTRSIDGGAFMVVSGVIAEVANGIYQFDAAAADTNGDVITWRFSAATAEDTFVTFKTVS